MQAHDQVGPKILSDFSQENSGEDRCIIYASSLSAPGRVRHPVSSHGGRPIMDSSHRNIIQGRVSDSVIRLTECCIGNRYVGQESLNMLILIGEELAQ